MGLKLGDLGNARVGFRNGKLTIYKASKGNVKALMPQMQRMADCAAKVRGMKGQARRSEMRVCLTK